MLEYSRQKPNKQGDALMELIIHEIANKISTGLDKNIKSMLLERKDISQFILTTKNMLDEIGRSIVSEALEMVDSIVKSDKNRKSNWKVKDTNKEKSLCTIFGEVKYKRTYYENKMTKEYSYLSDEYVGICANDRMDSSLEAKLIEESIHTTYRRSGSKASESVELSGQTVMNSIRKLGEIDTQIKEDIKIKSQVKVLYIEADEDHVSLQSKGNAEPKLVYVHEGKIEVSKDRYELINPRYFGGMYKSSEELWLEVASYIDSKYDEEYIDKIYLSGDGASWIKTGLKWIKKSVYVLDRFHMSKYIKKATSHVEDSERIMWKYLNRKSKKDVRDLFIALRDAAETESRKEVVNKSKNYILNNWTGVMNQYNADYCGCSAEGHISHILSSRLSSRPLSWSKQGVDQMSRLRIYVANGGDVYDLVKRRKNKEIKERKIAKLERRVVNQRIKKISYEQLGNIPAISMGKTTGIRRALKGLRTA